jgi:hypothetical protein
MWCGRRVVPRCGAGRRIGGGSGCRRGFRAHHSRTEPSDALRTRMHTCPTAAISDSTGIGRAASYTKAGVGSVRCMDGLSLQVTSVTIAAPDPRALAEFYSRLLGRPVTTSEGPRPGHPGGRLGADPSGRGDDRADPELRVRGAVDCAGLAGRGQQADRHSAPRHPCVGPRRRDHPRPPRRRLPRRLPAAGDRPGYVRPGRPSFLPLHLRHIRTLANNGVLFLDDAMISFQPDGIGGTAT